MTELAGITAFKLVEVLIEPWGSGAGLRSMLEMLLIAPVVGPLGVWITLSRLSYFAESCSHSLLPGIVAAGMIGLPILAGAPVAAIVCAAALLFLLARKRAIGPDSSVAVVVTTMLALGVAVSFAPSATPRLQELLFGNILGVTDLDLALTASLSAVALLGLWAFHRQLALTIFDRQTARSLGAGTGAADAALLALIAVAVTIAVQSLGNLLIVGLLLAPASAAQLLAGRLSHAFLLATFLAALAGVAGLYISHYAETAVGSSITLAALLVFVIARLVATARARDRGERASRRRLLVPSGTP